MTDHRRQRWKSFLFRRVFSPRSILAASNAAKTQATTEVIKIYSSPASLTFIRICPLFLFKSFNNWFVFGGKITKIKSHPVPKKLPLLRLVDQSNLWSGQNQPTLSGPWTRPMVESGVLSGTGMVHRPKATRNGPTGGKQQRQQHAESSPYDHSIAVWVVVLVGGRWLFHSAQQEYFQNSVFVIGWIQNIYVFDYRISSLKFLALWPSNSVWHFS